MPVRSTSTASQSGASLTISKPAGVQTDDRLVIALLKCNEAGSYSLPSGWVETRGIAGGMFLVAVRKVDGTEGSTFTFTGGTGTTEMIGVMVALTGINTTSGFVAAGASIPSASPTDAILHPEVGGGLDPGGMYTGIAAGYAFTTTTPTAESPLTGLVSKQGSSAVVTMALLEQATGIPAAGSSGVGSPTVAYRTALSPSTSADHAGLTDIYYRVVALPAANGWIVGRIGWSGGFGTWEATTSGTINPSTYSGTSLTETIPQSWANHLGVIAGVVSVPPGDYDVTAYLDWTTEGFDDQVFEVTWYNDDFSVSGTVAGGAFALPTSDATINGPITFSGDGYLGISKGLGANGGSSRTFTGWLRVTKLS